MSGRMVKDILKDLCSYSASNASPNARLPHDCYMIMVGRLKSEKHQQELLRRKNSFGIISNRECDETQAEYDMVKSENIEWILEHITLEQKTEELEFRRKNHFVYEDHFNSYLVNMVRADASYEKLKKICRTYEYKEGIDIDTVMVEHECRVNESYSYFRQKNIPLDEAKALAFALSFYTGTKSEACNRGASLVARKGNGLTFDEDIENEINDAAIILYYLVRALSHIPFYWGYVTRTCQLTFDELNLYVPGALITWIQFSSAKKGKKAVDSEAFKNRNVLFKIFSLTGRPIQQFSNYPEEEEVLFLPHSTFLVFNRKVDYGEQKQVIYMRQVELGLCTWSVLWVDDQIFDENWENKEHMEYAAVKSLDMNVHFIPKSSTDSALSFLRSTFGQRLKNQDTFRIVTDMFRSNEASAENAGARLIKAIRQMGFRNKCLVFAMDNEKAKQTLQSMLNSNETRSVSISANIEDLRNFVNFDRTSTYEKPFKAASSQPFGSSYNSPSSEKCSSFNPTTANSSEIYQKSVNDKSLKSLSATNQQTMHNRINTNIELIVKNCKLHKLTDSRYNCVLLTTGSFNPIQPFHFQNLRCVKEYLEHEHQPPWNVLAGYISPTHDSYVRPKLGDRTWIRAADRCKLCEEAIEYEGPTLSSWVSISRAESDWPHGFVNFGPVTENLRDFLNSKLVGQGNILKHELRVVYVCGLDHYNRCSDYQEMATKKNISFAVVYRPGCEERQILHATKTSGAIYIPLIHERNNLIDVSSEEIQRYFEGSNAKNDVIDRNIYPHVREYLRKKYKNK